MVIARNLKSQAMWRRDPRPASSSHRSSKFSDAEPKFFVVKSNDEGPKMTTNKVGGIFWIKDYPSTEIRRWPKFDSTLQLAPQTGKKTDKNSVRRVSRDFQHGWMVVWRAPHKGSMGGRRRAGTDCSPLRHSGGTNKLPPLGGKV